MSIFNGNRSEQKPYLNDQGTRSMSKHEKKRNKTKRLIKKETLGFQETPFTR